MPGLHLPLAFPCVLNKSLRLEPSASRNYIWVSPRVMIVQTNQSDPADSDQLCNTVFSQGDTNGRHEELLHKLMEGCHTLAENHGHAVSAFLEPIP
jgi:hypothetical protein